MRTQAEIQAELDKVRAERHAKAGSITEDESRAIGDKCKSLMAELSASLTDGAKPCPNCGVLPHGNHKQKLRFKKGSDGVARQEVPDLFVVRCLGCPPTETVLSTVGDEVDVQVVPVASSGETVAEAVENWNSGKRMTVRERRPVSA